MGGRRGEAHFLLDSQDEEEVRIPLRTYDLPSFRRWAMSRGFPRRGRIDFLHGVLEIDMSPEALGSHGGPKLAIVTALSALLHGQDLGEVWTDRARVSNVAADLSAEPDVLVCLWETLEARRARLVPRARRQRRGDFIEIEGSPDLVVEIVSDSSVFKDKEKLRARYHAARIREYWIVDARGNDLAFSVLAWGPRGFAATATDRRGFTTTRVLGRRVPLVRKPGRFGLDRYTLEVAPPVQR